MIDPLIFYYVFFETTMGSASTNPMSIHVFNLSSYYMLSIYFFLKGKVIARLNVQR